MKKNHLLFAGIFAAAALMALSPAAVGLTSDAAHQRTATTRHESATTAGLKGQSLRPVQPGKAPHSNASGSKSRQTARKSRSAKSRMIARAKAIRKSRLAKAKRQKQV